VPVYLLVLPHLASSSYHFICSQLPLNVFVTILSEGALSYSSITLSLKKHVPRPSTIFDPTPFAATLLLVAAPTTIYPMHEGSACQNQTPLDAQPM